VKVELRETSLIEVFAHDPEERARRLVAEFESIQSGVAALPVVVAAREAFVAAEEHARKLNAALLSMNARARHLAEIISTTAGTMESDIVESFMETGGITDGGSVTARLSAAEGERAALSRAIRRVNEIEIPSASMSRETAEGFWHRTSADQFERIAQERTRKTFELMREAAEFEHGIAFDVASTLSGALQRHADSLSAMAARCSDAVSELQRVEKLRRMA
jgi:hypothetical protein